MKALFLYSVHDDIRFHFAFVELVLGENRSLGEAAFPEGVNGSFVPELRIGNDNICIKLIEKIGAEHPYYFRAQAFSPGAAFTYKKVDAIGIFIIFKASSRISSLIG